MIRFPKSNSPSFLVPPGIHPAVCFAVVELGTQDTGYGRKPRLRISWETPNELLSNGQPATVWHHRHYIRISPAFVFIVLNAEPAGSANQLLHVEQVELDIGKATAQPPLYIISQRPFGIV
jgi:hypothetical protein